MCGILGVVAHHDASLPHAAVLERMRDTMTHRGPDDAGLWIDPVGVVALAHRRLAIIDPGPAAGQPMSTSDGRFTITFNGEIYNHAEIRTQLKREGLGPWRTDHSDTEVILHAFAAWGIDCVHKFRGMFAFGLWDRDEQELWLVRDRIGVKPVYIASTPGGTVFASEIKALLEMPGLRPAVDEEALFHYLSFLVSPAPRTLFRGVEKLEAGTWTRVSVDGRRTTTRYWDPFDDVVPIADGGDDELGHQLLDLLDEAVQLRKVADVPVGVFLSGGVDSSTNAALFSNGEAAGVSTFSIGYTRDYASYTNELDFARQMARRVGSSHHELLLSPHDVQAFVPRMVELQDEPIADPVCVPVHYVSRLARDNGTVVCQVGEGADELYAGYTNWMGMLRLQDRLNRTVVGAAARSVGPVVRALGVRGGHRGEYLRRHADGHPVFWGGAEAFFSAEKSRLLSARVRHDLAGLSSWDAIAPIRQEFEVRAWEPTTLNWMTYLDLKIRLPELLLMRVDKMSMGASIESRVPFLDHRLVAQALSIPTEAKLRRGRKGLLRHAVRGLVPDEIIDRPKQGFALPVADMLTDGLGRQIREEVASFCDQADLLDRTVALDVVDRGGSSAWYLYNLALWWRRFVA